MSKKYTKPDFENLGDKLIKPEFLNVIGDEEDDEDPEDPIYTSEITEPIN